MSGDWLTLILAAGVQLGMLAVLVRWAMRKDRRLRAEDPETAEGGVAHAVQHRR